MSTYCKRCHQPLGDNMPMGAERAVMNGYHPDCLEIVQLRSELAQLKSENGQLKSDIAGLESACDAAQSLVDTLSEEDEAK